MENGSGEHPPPPNPLALAPANVVVTPENYWQHRQQIQRIKEGIAQYERDLQAGYEQYLTQEAELKKRVEAGRQAEQMLAQMQGAGGVTSAGPSNARSQTYPSASNPQSSASSSSQALQTFPPANPQAHYSRQAQLNSTAYRQQPPTMVVAYEQYTSPPPPYQQHAGQYGNEWPRHAGASGTNQQVQYSQYTGHAQGQAGTSQSQHRMPVPSQPNVANGTGQTQAMTAGLSVQQQPAHQQPNPQPHQQQQQQQQQQRQPPSLRPHRQQIQLPPPQQQQQQQAQQQPRNLPEVSGRHVQAPTPPGQSSTPNDIKRATATYVSQARQREQGLSAATVYQNVHDLLKELRPEMVDYIIFSALDSLKHKLPSGAIQGQNAFQKVREQLPPHSVEHLSKISNFVVQQLEVLEPGAIRSIVVRIKQNALQRASGTRWFQQSTAAAQGAAESGPQPTPVQPPSGFAGEAFGQSSAPPTIRPTKPASPPSLAGALGNDTNVKAKVPPQQAIHLQSSQPAGPSLSTPIPFQDIPGSSPSRRTIFPLNRPPTVAAPAQTTPHGPKPSSNGQATASPSVDRPKGPWIPATPDKTRLAQSIFQALGRPSTSAQTPVPVPLPSSSQDSVDSTANKRKRTPSVTESPLQKKQKVGMEVEEIATDGAFELAVWQEQSSDRASVAGSETSAPQKPSPSGVSNDPIQMQDQVEGSSSHASQADSRVDGFGGAPTQTEETFAPPAPFPSIGDYLGLHISQNMVDVEQRESGVDHNQHPVYSLAQEPPSSPHTLASVGTAPPTSRTASPAPVVPIPPADPDTPVAQPGPSTAKTPLFFPSPTSDDGHDDSRDDVSDPNDYAKVFASAFSANADMDKSPRRLPTRAKGKARVVVDDAGDEDSRSVLKKPEVQRKQHIVDSGSDIELVRGPKNRGRKSDDSEVEVLPETLPSKRRISRKATQPIVNRAYVLVPRIPKWAKKLREKEKEEEGLKSKRKARKTSTPESADELAMDDVPDPERLQEEQAQQELVQLAINRLHEMQCLWRGCDAILNSTESLTRHVRCHAEEEGAAGFPCGWWGCNRTFISGVVLTHHVVRHASTQLFCAFEGCEKSFATPKELYRHFKNGRHRSEKLKPLTKPYKPETFPFIPPLPPIMPSYMQVSCPVIRHPVSRVVHQWLSPKVLEDLSSFHFAGRRMHHNAPSRSSRRLADKIAAVEEEGKTPAAKIELLRRLNDDEYQQVGNGRELRPAMRCADIPSGEVTALLENGYIMFPPPGYIWEAHDNNEDDNEDENEDGNDGGNVDMKSEPDRNDFVHGDRDLDGGHDVGEGEGTLISDHAVLDGREGDASQSDAEGSGARPEAASGTTAGRDYMAEHAADGAPSTQVRQISPLPGWEVLAGASEPQQPSSQPEDQSECLLS